MKDDTQEMEFFSYEDSLQRDVSIVFVGGKATFYRQSLFKEPLHLNENSIRLAILGDLHGRIVPALNHLKNWLDFTDLHVDGILQVGDFGAYDLQTVLDPTTKNISKKDSNVLGFSDIREGSKDADKLFRDNGPFQGIPLYFTDGNHDDIDFLRNRYISAYPEVNYLPSGSAVQFGSTNVQVSVGSIGWHATKQDVNAIRSAGVDILLSHDYKLNNAHKDRLSEITDGFHFFGHRKNEHSKPEEKSYRIPDYQIGMYEKSLDQQEIFFYAPKTFPGSENDYTSRIR